MIRRRYLSRLFLGRVVAALLGLAGLLQLLDLLDNASDVLSRGGSGELWLYAARRLPSVLAQMMPLAVLIAAMLSLRRLAMTSEMAALRSAGVPVRSVLSAMLPVCLLAVLAQGVLSSVVAPRTERALAEWMARTDTRAIKPPSANPPRIWMRVGRDIVGIDRISPDGRELQGLLLVTRSPERLILARTDARRASRTTEGWVLHDVSVAAPGGETLRHLAEQPWPQGPAPAEIVEAARPTNAQTPGLLTRSLRGEQPAARGPAFFTTRLHESAARLLSPLVMLLLAAPMAFATPRRGAQMLAPLLCLALGLGFLLSGGLLGALGEAAILPAPLAVWSVPVVFATIGAMLLMHYDER